MHKCCQLMRCLTVLVFWAGCAGVDVRTIGADPAKDKSAQGYRYYQQAPYLLVATDNEGGLTSQILYLPDTSMKMSVEPYSYAALNDTTLKFEGGVLTSASTIADETVIPKAALEALKEVLAAAVKSAAFDIVQQQTVAPTPSLYKIVVKGEVVQLVGGQGSPTEINTGIQVGQ